MMSVRRLGGFVATLAVTAATFAAGAGIAQADDAAVTPPPRAAERMAVHSPSSTGTSDRSVAGSGQKTWKGRPPTGICMYRPCRP
jgi:hypothetical protein